MIYWLLIFSISFIILYAFLHKARYNYYIDFNGKKIYNDGKHCVCRFNKSCIKCNELLDKNELYRE